MAEKNTIVNEIALAKSNSLNDWLDNKEDRNAILIAVNKLKKQGLETLALNQSRFAYEKYSENSVYTFQKSLT